MSRKGKLPIALPKGVEVKVTPTQVTVKGPKGTLTQTISEEVIVKVEGDHINVSLNEKHTGAANLHGLYRTLIANMVTGTTTGFERDLEMVGVGYRAAIQGQKLDVQVGYSHPTPIDIPQGITVKVEKGTAINISGADKQKVGQFAAAVRAIRPPEPYQGKGIRHKGEHVRRKVGKAAAAKK